MQVSAQQLNELLTYCIDFARTMLESSGEFYPFGADIASDGASDGKVRAVGGYNGQEKPNSPEIYTLLGGAFKAAAQKGQVAAVALAANVNVPPQYSSPSPDALRVHLEASGYSRFVYVPYSLTKSGLFKKTTAVQFAEPFAVAIPPTFFPPKP